MHLCIANAHSYGIFAVLAHHARIVARFGHRRPDAPIEVDEAGQVGVDPRDRKRRARKELLHGGRAHGAFEMNVQLGLSKAREVTGCGDVIHDVVAIFSQPAPSGGSASGLARPGRHRLQGTSRQGSRSSLRRRARATAVPPPLRSPQSPHRRGPRRLRY